MRCGRTPRSAPSRDEHSFVASLKQNKVVQWALAYLTGAWVALQLLGEVQEPWNLAQWALRAAQVVLAYGLPITLVLAWHHGKRGKQRVTLTELMLIALVVMLMVLTLWLVVAR